MVTRSRVETADHLEIKWTGFIISTFSMLNLRYLNYKWIQEVNFSLNTYLLSDWLIPDYYHDIGLSSSHRNRYLYHEIAAKSLNVNHIIKRGNSISTHGGLVEKVFV